MVGVVCVYSLRALHTHTDTPAHIHQYMSISRTHDMYMGIVSLLTILALYVFLISIRSIQNVPVSPASNPDCRFQKQRGDRKKKKNLSSFFPGGGWESPTSASPSKRAESSSVTLNDAIFSRLLEPVCGDLRFSFVLSLSSSGSRHSSSRLEFSS